MRPPDMAHRNRRSHALATSRSKAMLPLANSAAQGEWPALSEYII
jgi:hypothetical protein